MTVSKESIVAASIKILNRDGIERLSMRTLAKELEIKAASLYWHIKDKRELYGAIAEHLCGGFNVPDNSNDPKGYLTESSKAYRAILLSVRDSVAVMEESPPITPRRVEIIKTQADALLKMGIKPQNLMTVANLLNNYVLSFVADELRMKNTPVEEMARISKILSPAELPAISNAKDYDGQFLYGLQVVFAGLATVEN